MKEVGGEEFFGATLKRKIETTLAENQMTPTVAADELEQVRQRMEQFHNALNQASSAFGTFRISDEKLAPGECEIGVLVPRDAVDNRLVPFADELRELSFILQTFSEVATGKPDDLAIKTISSSGLLVYILASPLFAACLARAVERVVGLYKSLLEIRKIQLEIRSLGVPDESTQGIEEYANHHMDRGIEKVSVEIVNEFYMGADGGRKNELTNAVRISLNKIANRIDNGYNIEVRCEPLPAAEETAENAEQRAAIAAVQAASANMQFLKLEGKPLLRLPEERLEEPGKTEESEKPRKPKKKAGSRKKQPVRETDHIGEKL